MQIMFNVSSHHSHVHFQIHEYIQKEMKNDTFSKIFSFLDNVYEKRLQIIDSTFCYKLENVSF